VGQQSAIESIAEIEKMLDPILRWFYHYGNGGGYRCSTSNRTVAKEEKFLLGIVTLPFLFEGKVRQEQAKIGIEKNYAKQVDSLLLSTIN
jgi:cell division protein FtsZ